MAAIAHITGEQMLRNADVRGQAIASFEATRRRRRIRSTFETTADAALATGGLFLANAGLHLGMGLPEGRNGVALGGTLVAAGMIWVTRKITRSQRDDRGPASLSTPALLTIDAERAIA